MWILPFAALLTSVTSSLGAAPTCDDGAASVALLATYHFVSEQNVVRQSDDDELSERRQREIEDLVDRLQAFRPTRIAVERPYDQAELDRRYSEYLSGDYQLTAEETDQIAFRLGKRAGLPRLEWIQYVGEFPLEEVANFAEQAGRQQEYERAISFARVLAAQLDQALADGGIVAAMRLMNSPEAIAANHRSYIGLNAIADTENPGGARPGPDLVSAWYRTNLNIFANIQNLAEPGDRLFILYGQGHAHILRQLIRDDPNLCLIDLLPVLDDGEATPPPSAAQQ